MWVWMRLFWLLAALGGAGILVVHSQTAVVTTGYRIGRKIQTREALKEKNRMLRIELGRAGVWDQIRESYKALSERDAPEGAQASGSDNPGNVDPGSADEGAGRELEGTE